MKKKFGETRQLSLRTSLFMIITALIIQYCLLEGPAAASVKKYLPPYSSAASSCKYNQLQYSLDDYVLELKVPDATEMHVTPDKGEEMQFNLYFTNSELALRGYIQLWKIKDLEYFLKNSKNLSPFDFISFDMSNIEQNYREGFKTEWSADFGGTYVSGKEFWWKINHAEDVVRVSFYTDTADFPEELNPIIQDILNSLQVSAAS